MSLNDVWNGTKDFFDKSWWQNVIFTALTFLLGYFVSWYKRNDFLVRYILRYLKSLFIRKKYVLIWNDDSLETSERIISSLKEKQPFYRYKALDKSERILGYPLLPKFVHAVIVIVTDVTKLSDVETKRDKIQDLLINYVGKGGVLIGTHDIIYRRCRNSKLQKYFGCEVRNFVRVSEPIQVSITGGEKDHPLLTNLPQRFELDDGELCWGEWNKGAITLIKTEDKFKNNNNNVAVQVPMLVIRHTSGYGTLIWLNSADKFDDLSRSLSQPQKEIVQIFQNAIQYSSQIVEYYKTNHQ